jgi:hypothetical protein
VLDLRGGRRVAVPGFNFGAFFSLYQNEFGRKGKEQKLWRSPVSAGSEFGLVLTNCSGAK